MVNEATIGMATATHNYYLHKANLRDDLYKYSANHKKAAPLIHC